MARDLRRYDVTLVTIRRRTSWTVAAAASAGIWPPRSRLDGGLLGDQVLDVVDSPGGERFYGVLSRRWRRIGQRTRRSGKPRRWRGLPQARLLDIGTPRGEMLILGRLV